MKKRVLIIDDYKLIANSIKEDLVNIGFEVFIICSFIEGLKFIKNEKIDILLIEIELSDINGLEIVKIIKSDNELNHIKTVVFTSFSEFKPAAAKLGCEGFLLKPFTPNDVIDIFNKLK